MSMDRISEKNYILQRLSGNQTKFDPDKSLNMNKRG